MRFKPMATLTLAAGAAAAAAVSGCAVNPVTGERQLSLISEGQEIRMGEDYARQVEASIGLVDDDALQAYVSGIGKTLAAGSERPQLPWRFAVVDDPTPNAFALPGGFIYVTRGLLSLMDSEAELAAVIGHEIGHVTARHSVSQMSRQQIAQLGLGLGMIFVPAVAEVGDLAGAGLQLLFLKYGRDDEHQADELGFRYAFANHYDVRQMSDVFRSLERAGENAGSSGVPSWLSTHPFPAERIERTNQRVAALERPLPELNTGEAEYMGQIDAVVYGTNPRNGYFRGAAFLHPELRFRIDLPEGWQYQNMTQAVMAGSPQQDALIQLTLAQGTPEAAARQFLSQQGIRGTAPTRETVNGLSAVSARFEAQTEDAVLRGDALYIAHGGDTYQILAYTRAARFSDYEPVFRRSLGSFARLTDAQALGVQPDRIEVVRVPENMTLAQFNQRYPSEIDITELALINQLSGPDQTIPAGTRVKRVTGGS